MERLDINKISAVVFGENSEKIFLFINGKNGTKEEALNFAAII